MHFIKNYFPKLRHFPATNKPLAAVITRYCLQSILLLLVSGTCFSQSSKMLRKDSIRATNISRDYPNILRAVQKQNYIGFVTHNIDTPLIFEARFAPEYNFIQNDKNWSVRFQFVTVFRMLSARSAPIYTPSYVPSLSFTYFYNGHAATYENEVISFSTLKVAHYSNGQSGNFYNPDGSVNNVTGNFSTNYIEVTQSACKSFAENNGNVSKTWALLSIAFRHDIGANTGVFSIEDGLKNSYGVNRIKLQAKVYRNLAVNNLKERKWDISGDLEICYLLDKSNNIDLYEMSEVQRRLGLLLSVTLHCPEKWSNFGIYSQFYWGSDYYNINYFRFYRQFLIGLTADINRFEIPSNAGKINYGKN